MTQSFFIHAILPGANDVTTAHRHVYAQMKRDYGMLVRVAIRKAKLKPMEAAEIHFYWRELPATKQNRRDPDNIRFGAKFVLDALVAEKILLDDSIDYISGLSDEFLIPDLHSGAKPGVLVELTGRPRKKEPA